MINKLENLPNEILILIFSNLSWFEIIKSLWSINQRINSVICSIFSIDNTRYNNGIVLTQPGLSHMECSTILLPIISKSSCLSSSIRCIHFDDANSNSSEYIYQWLVDNQNRIVHCVNLKSLTLTRCLLSETLIKSLSLLVEIQLDELRLTFDQDVFLPFLHELCPFRMGHDSEKLFNLLREFLNQIFSDKSRLTSFQLGVIDIACTIHQFFPQRSQVFRTTIHNELQSHCLTLRYLNLHLPYICFLEDLIECTPNLEQLFIRSPGILKDRYSDDPGIERMTVSTKSWFDKLPKLRSFSLKSYLLNDYEFVYLKWILNRLNYTQKLQLHLENNATYRPDQLIWRSRIDANFIRQYCLPDIVYNLIDFDFYISSDCQLSLKDVEDIINSFKIDSFYITHRWTNVKCFYDPNESCQHLFSSDNTIQLFDGLTHQRYIDAGLNGRDIWITVHPSVYLFLEKLDELFPNVDGIKVHTGAYKDNSQILPSLLMPFKLGQRKISDIKFRNITKLQFGLCHSRINDSCSTPINQNIARAKVLAHLISMPIQLKHLIVECFEWLLHVVQFASDELDKDALNAVQYLELFIPSCIHGDNEDIRIGEQLVPFLSNYMSRIQTLHLWRPDDFPWTSIRPDFKPAYKFDVLFRRWLSTLRTPESITEHVIIFERDLNQLFEQLKQLVFLDIVGSIQHEKVEPYRLMVQKRFPNSQINVETPRFRLWL